MFLTFKKWTALYLLTLLLLFVGFAAILWQGSAVNASKNLRLETAKELVLIIDPGHGGVDGGAVGADGTVESQINLAIGLQMEELAQLIGLDTRMTRREDVSIHDPEAQTIRAKKVSDLKNRVALINAVPGGVLVSLHQNSLPTAPGVRGAQVFYNGVPGSKELAEAVQAALNDVLNASPKMPEQTGSGVYLMAHSEAPSILVECGFLSNAEETALLNTQPHQTKLSMVILTAALAHLMQPEAEMPPAASEPK